MRIAFDSDGVLDNFGEGVRQTLVARGLGHLWKSGPTPKPFWNFYQDWKNEDGSNWTFQQFKELVDWGVDQGIVFSGHWRDGAREAVDRVRALGHTVVIITDRSFGSIPENSKRNTLRAYREAGIQYDEIHFSADKTCVPVDMMVEDKLENYDKLDEAGVDVYLINRPWNDDPHDDWRMRIDSVTEFASWVELKTEWLARV